VRDWLRLAVDAARKLSVAPWHNRATSSASGKATEVREDDEDDLFFIAGFELN